MPMVVAGLSAAIKAEIEAEFDTPQSEEILQKFSDAVAKAVVEYIQANALVTVTSGAGAGGNGTVS